MAFSKTLITVEELSNCAPKRWEKVSFNANLFKDVLTANKECESATLYVAQDGLSKINFKVDDYDATYYLVAVQDVD